MTAGAVADAAALAERAGLVVRTALGEGDLDGVPPLVRQLVANLVLNGIRHNTGPGGWVGVTTGTTADGRAELRVTNTGPVVAPEVLAVLTEPFVRGGGRSAARGPGGGTPAPAGSGLGLALVAQVARSHGAELELTAPAGGGLEVRVTFPAPGA